MLHVIQYFKYIVYMHVFYAIANILYMKLMLINEISYARGNARALH
jgi:hypothetical protein